MNKVFRIVVMVLVVLTVVAGLGYWWANSVAMSRYNKTWTAHDDGFPIPFPLSESEIESLKADRIAAGARKSDPLAGVDMDSVYAGGDFYSLGGARRPCLGAVDDSVGMPTDWTPEANFVVDDISISDDVLYVGGSFGSVGLQPNSGLAALSLPIRPEPPPPPPTRVTLAASVPNSASTLATIRFTLSRAQEVTLSLFDTQGRRLQRLLDQRLLPPGGQQIQLDASRWRPGIYFYRLETGGQSWSMDR